jgi:hypothetical protein
LCRVAVVVGEYGQGKTATALHLANRMIDAKSQRIPIYFSLKGKAPRNAEGFDIMASFSSSFGIDLNALKILNDNGRLLLILDGFDEMDFIGDWGVRKLHFRSLWKLVTPSTKMILTGRPNYFADIDEFSSALLDKITNHNIPYGSIVSLQKFSPEQVSAVLDKVDVQIKTEIESVLTKSTSKQFADLISRPSNLSLVIRMWKARNLIEKSNNLTAASVIDEFLKNSYERQLEKNTQSSYNVLSPLEREYFMLGVALQMYDAQLNNLDSFLLESFIDNLAERFPDQISKQTPSIFNFRNGRNFRDFYFDSQRPENRSSIITDIRTCGVLVNDEMLNSFTFAHKSFYDLLVAKCFWGKYLPNNDVYHTISGCAFERPNVTIKAIRSSDLTHKKLLTELLVPLFVDADGEDGHNPLFLFKKCYKLIVSPFFGKVSPSNAFKNYRAMLNIEPVQANSSAKKMEIRRFLLMSVIAMPLCIVAFFAQWVHLSVTLKEEAVAAFKISSSYVERMNLPDNSYIEPSRIWVILALILFLSGLIAAIYFIRKRINKDYAKKVDVAFFVWYYASQDAGIPTEALLNCFNNKTREQFHVFISRLELNFDEGGGKVYE